LKKINYKCDKCRDMTLILLDNVATPCECRELRLSENILKSSGINEEFRKKTFDNFDYSVECCFIDSENDMKIYNLNVVSFFILILQRQGRIPCLIFYP